MLLRWKFKFLGRRPEYEEVRDYILSKMPRHGMVAEIGVDQARFSRRILKINQPSRLYLIDPWLQMQSRGGGFCRPRIGMKASNNRSRRS